MVKRLGEISTIQKGKISEQSEYPKEGFLPIINTDFLRGNIHVWGKIQGSVLSEEDDVLILWDGERSGLSAVGHVGVLGSTFSKIKSDNEIDSNYLYRFIDGKFDWIQNQRTGTGVPHVPKDLDKILKIEYPPLPQQRKIAKILSTCDTVIAKTEEAIGKYQAIKQGMMHDLFTRGIDLSTGKLRPKYQDAPELYKESELGKIPKDWEVKELDKITSLITDGAHFSPVPQEKGMPIGNVKDMTSSGFKYETCTRILPEVFNLLARQNCSPKNGDVLLSKDGTIGRVIYFTDERPIVLLSSIAIIRSNESVHPLFLANALGSEYFDKSLYALLSGSALKRITLKDIQKIKIVVPNNIKEQELFNESISSITKKLSVEKASLLKHVKLKSGLMEDLLSGKVEVSVSKEEEIVNA
jgi:type I restriction enzyme S subunit